MYLNWLEHSDDFLFNKKAILHILLIALNSTYEKEQLKHYLETNLPETCWIQNQINDFLGN